MKTKHKLSMMAFALLIANLLPAGLLAQTNLGFETAGAIGAPPPSWGGYSVVGSGFSSSLTNQGCTEGRQCAMITGPADLQSNWYGLLSQYFNAASLRGQLVRMRAAVRVEGDGTSVKLWVGDSTSLNMQSAPITSSQWRYYEILARIGDQPYLSIGFIFHGSGTAWVDDVSFTVSSAAVISAGAYNISPTLGFENNGSAGVLPAGWSGTANNTIFADNQVAHSGTWSARIERAATSATDTGSLIYQYIPMDFSGQTIQLTAWAKTEDVKGSIGIWMREYDANGSGAFASSQGLQVSGTTDWTQYSISLPWSDKAQQLGVGFLLGGTGKAWVDDFALYLDGKPLAAFQDVLNTDHEFDGGSGITPAALSDTQISNLATLGKVWGFLKYHHPAVTFGQHQWDYDLFRIMPQVLAAPDQASANAAISTWVAGLGPVTPCSPCATLETSNLYMSPDLGWLADESLLGPDLSYTLQKIYANRTAAAAQFFVSLKAITSNPSFDHELPYGSLKLPDPGYQLLALFRYWNMVQYFYPDRDIMSNDPANTNYWNQVLVDSIPRFALAQDSSTYQQELLRFIARINDTHANLNVLDALPPVGACYLPVDTRFVEGQAVVLRNTELSGGVSSGLLPGDIILQLDGSSVPDLVTEWAPLYPASNQAARLRAIGQYLTRGACGPVPVVVQRGDQTLNLQPGRLPAGSIDFSRTNLHDLPGQAFQMLSPDIAYLKLSAVKAADSAGYIQSAAGTKGLIIDIRNYPSDYVVYTLGSLLVAQPTDFVRLTQGDISNPGAFHWQAPLRLTPQQPHYDGKVIILVDEVSRSQAEFTTMAFRSAPGALVIGSTTAGADGDVSAIPLPGGFSSKISGVGVFYPNERPTQRIGILPDVVATPTIAGIRAGRDELIDEAIRRIEAAASAGPTPRIDAVVNSASFAGGPVAPGELVTIFGSNLGPAQLVQTSYDGSGYLGAYAADTRVFFDNIQAPLVYTSAGQVTAVVPYAVASSTKVRVEYQLRSSDAVNLQVAAAAPGIFAYGGKSQAVVVNQDSTFNSDANPAPRGSTVALFATGEGPTTPAGLDGKLPAVGKWPVPARDMSVTFGGVPGKVEFKGEVNAGVLQVNVTVPQDAPVGSAVPLLLIVGGASSPAGTTIAVK